MRYYISFLLFGLLALTFTSCNTDDLEKDVDALKDRVANFEVQMQQMNDEMNIIRIALDGNKTITDYSYDGETYTLTLSNGETLKLAPGVIGGNYPAIEIGENGNWVIAGKDTGWRAESTDGKDSTITPKFKIEANPADGGKKYWYVSYNNGTTWTVLENGLAEGTNANTNPISNAEVVGDNFKVTYDGKDYFIPIVKGLECAINTPKGMVDGLWTVAGGGTSTFTVKVKIAEGDLVRVKAPLNWNAKLLSYAVGATEVTVTVTPPSTPSECVIVVEVTHGVNAATDQIKAKTISDSYWAEYQAGLDIKIGDVMINKYDYPDGKLLANGEQISVNGVYFIAENASVDWTGGTSNQIIVSEKKSSFSKLGVNNAKNTNLNLGQGGESVYGILIKGVQVLCPIGSYAFNTTANTTTKRVVFDHCQIQMTAGKPFTYFSAKGSIDNILIESCRFSIPATTAVINLLNCYNAVDARFGNITIRNNVFYSTAADKSIPFLLVTAPNVNTVVGNVDVRNNTLLNVSADHGSSSGYIKLPLQAGWMMKKNLVWYDVDYINGGGIATLISTFGTGAFSADNLENNKVFAASTTNSKWSYFRTDPKQPGFVNAITLSTDKPFVEGTLLKTEGKYTLKPEYKDLGATIE